MNPPLSQSARRFLFALAIGGAALLAVILLWLAPGPRQPEQRPEAGDEVLPPDRSEPSPAPQASPAVPVPPAAPPPVPPPPAPAPPAAWTQTDQLLPEKPLGERLQLTKTLKPLVGWAKAALDAGQGTGR
jgi:type IV secretory pathway VirB10-like protein